MTRAYVDIGVRADMKDYVQAWRDSGKFTEKQIAKMAKNMEKGFAKASKASKKQSRAAKKAWSNAGASITRSIGAINPALGSTFAGVQALTGHLDDVGGAAGVAKFAVANLGKALKLLSVATPVLGAISLATWGVQDAFARAEEARENLNFAASSGFSVEMAASIRQGLDQIGKQFSDVGPLMEDFAEKLYMAAKNGGGAEQAFSDFGVSLEDVRSGLVTQDQALDQVLNSLGEMESRTQAAARAKQIFGGAAKDVVKLAEAWELVRKEAALYGEAEDSAIRMATASAEWDAATRRLTGTLRNLFDLDVSSFFSGGAEVVKAIGKASVYTAQGFAALGDSSLLVEEAWARLTGNDDALLDVLTRQGEAADRLSKYQEMIDAFDMEVIVPGARNAARALDETNTAIDTASTTYAAALQALKDAEIASMDAVDTRIGRLLHAKSKALRDIETMSDEALAAARARGDGAVQELLSQKEATMSAIAYQWDQVLEEAKWAELKERIGTVGTALGSLSQLTGGIGAIVGLVGKGAQAGVAEARSALDELEAKRDQMSEAEFERQRALAIGEVVQKKKAARKAFAAQKVLQVKTASMNAIQAVLSAMAAPWPISIGATVAAGIGGAANVAAIAATPAPKLHIGRAPMSSGGLAPDEQMTVVRSNEAMVTRAGVEQLLDQRINHANGGQSQGQVAQILALNDRVIDAGVTTSSRRPTSGINRAARRLPVGHR